MKLRNDTYEPENPPPLAGEGWSLFLDLDGTLFEISERPEEVTADEEVSTLLALVTGRLGGAVAVLSGRALSKIDSLTAPHRLPAAGLHGAERRDAGGHLHRVEVDRTALETISERLASSPLAREPGILIEEKDVARAIHYRQRPDLAERAERTVAAVLEGQDHAFTVQPGKMVLEIKPVGINKGSALHAFTQEAPFHSRRPVMVGDDLTDETAFREARRLGGYGVRVGSLGESEALFALPSVAEVRTWLRRTA